MPVYPEKEYVQSLFKKARIMNHPTRLKFRVFLQWRHEPDLPWTDTRERAWDDAKHFLDLYPNSRYVNIFDPAWSSRGL